MRKGEKIKDGDVNLKEVMDLYIEVADAIIHDKIIKKYSDYKMINWMIKENSNMAFSLQGLNNYIANKIISIVLTTPEIPVLNFIIICKDVHPFPKD